MSTFLVLHHSNRSDKDIIARYLTAIMGFIQRQANLPPTALGLVTGARDTSLYHRFKNWNWNDTADRCFKKLSTGAHNSFRHRGLCVIEFARKSCKSKMMSHRDFEPREQMFMFVKQMFFTKFCQLLDLRRCRDDLRFSSFKQIGII